MIKMPASVAKFLQRVIPIPQRVVLTIMMFFAIVNAYTMRVCLSNAITEMVKKNQTDAGTDDTCPLPEGREPIVRVGDDLFDWSGSLQGVILSSFFWGYVITHIPGGLLAQKYGGKYVLSLGILSTAIFTLLTPVIIDAGGAPALIALRVLEGFGEGTTFPALNALLALWVPITERSTVGAIVFGGAQVGNILGNLISGIVIDAFDDWRATFYTFGILGLLWFFFFELLCYSDPASHPFIKDSEKEMLAKELGSIKRDNTLPPTPFLAIFKNKPMIALIVAQIGHDFGFFIMVSDLPKYMSEVLHFNIKENGLYTALPYLFMWIISLSSGALGDWLLKKKYITITFNRKMFTTIASLGPACFIVGASYAGCNRAVVIVLFTIAMGLMGTFYAGMKVNALDLSPNYAGSLMAITNGIGALTGIIGPYIVGVITTNSYLSEWRIVFWITFCVFNVTNVVYLLWASGEVQESINNPIKNDTIEKGNVISEKTEEPIKQT